MLIVLSPAKTLAMEPPLVALKTSVPDFIGCGSAVLGRLIGSFCVIGRCRCNCGKAESNGTKEKIYEYFFHVHSFEMFIFCGPGGSIDTPGRDRATN